MRLRLNGQVTSDQNAKLYRRYGYDVCCPEDIREAVERCKDGEELVLELNSGGGSVYAGFEMYTLVRSYPGHTVAHVQSIAGSAMSAVMSGCDEVLMSPVANVMIHRASTVAWGNSRVMGETKQMLDTIDESILNAYDERVKGKTSREKLLELMRKETFLTAQRAIDLGFADGVLPPGSGESAGAEPEKAAASFAGGMGELPPIEDLRRREREMEEKQEKADGAGLGTDAEKTARRLEVSAAAGGQEPEAMGHTNDRGNLGGMNTQTRRDAGMEIKTVEQLAQAFPELVDQIRREAADQATAQGKDSANALVEAAVKAERARILGIEEVAVDGFEQLIAKAKADPEQNASTVAVAIVKAQKEQGATFLEGRKTDAEKANEVTGAAAPESGEETAEAKADADAKAAVAEFYGKEEE